MYTHKQQLIMAISYGYTHSTTLCTHCWYYYVTCWSIWQILLLFIVVDSKASALYVLQV